MLLVDSIFLAIMVVLLPKRSAAMPGFEVVSCTKPRAFICSSFSHALDALDALADFLRSKPWPLSAWESFPRAPVTRTETFLVAPFAHWAPRRFLGWTWRHLKFEPMEIYKMLDILYIYIYRWLYIYIHIRYIIIDDYIYICIYIYVYILDIFRTWITLNLMVHLGLKKPNPPDWIQGGDVQPFLALSLELQKRGHQVVICCPACCLEMRFSSTVPYHNWLRF